MGKAKAKLTPAEKAQRRLHTIKHLKQYSALYATAPARVCLAPNGPCATLSGS